MIPRYQRIHKYTVHSLYNLHISSAKFSSTSTSSGSRLEQLRLRLQTENTTNKPSLRTPPLSSPSNVPSTNPVSSSSTIVHPSDTNTLISNSLSSSTSPLLDRFGRQHRYLRISLTERCNLRCLYCMPEEGIDLSSNTALLTTKELYQLSSLFVSLGIEKIRLTGGEPTLRKDLSSIIEYLSTLSPQLHTIAITTNGILLHKQLDTLINNGLNQINISLDTLKPDKFEKLSRRPGQTLHRVFDSIYSCIDYYQKQTHIPVSTAVSKPKGLKYPLKLNMVVIRNINDDEILDFINLTIKYPIQLRFIEYMPFPGNAYKQEAIVGWKEIMNKIQTIYPDIQPYQSNHPLVSSETAKLYTIPNTPGQFGFISTMTNIFCSTCDRLRLTADGNIRTCLHGETEYNLRDTLRMYNDQHSFGNTKDVYTHTNTLPLISNQTHNNDYTIPINTPLYNQLCTIIHTAVQHKHAALGGNKNTTELINHIQGLSSSTLHTTNNSNTNSIVTTKNNVTNTTIDRSSEDRGSSSNNTSPNVANNNNKEPQKIQQYRPMIKIGG